MRILLLLFCSSCLSAERADARFSQFLEDNQACTVDEDCTVLYPGCPLGCFAAVRTDAVDEAREVADQLIGRYGLLGRQCFYDCIQDEGAACDEGTCTVVTPTN